MKGVIEEHEEAAACKAQSISKNTQGISIALRFRKKDNMFFELIGVGVCVVVCVYVCVCICLYTDSTFACRSQKKKTRGGECIQTTHKQEKTGEGDVDGKYKKKWKETRDVSDGR